MYLEVLIFILVLVTHVHTLLVVVTTYIVLIFILVFVTHVHTTYVTRYSHPMHANTGLVRTST
jgi:hypothetical protein